MFLVVKVDLVGIIVMYFEEQCVDNSRITKLAEEMLKGLFRQNILILGRNEALDNGLD